MSNVEFEWPWQYNFPPFFTLQPNLTTRKKQFEAWKTLILEYCKASKLYLLDVTEAQLSPLFFNKSIGRKVSPDVIRMILDELCQQGNAEWLDKQKNRCYVYWRTPEEWGKLIYKWAEDCGAINTMHTMYEVIEGDDTGGQEFHGLDAGVLKKALHALEKEGLAEVVITDEVEGFKLF